MHAIHRNLLWLGHALDLRSPRALFDAQISAIVDLAHEEAPAQPAREFTYCRFPLNDGGGNEPRLLAHAVSTVVALLDSGTRTIVGCSAGMSRSPTIAAFALAAHLGHRPEEALARIANIKSLEIKQPLWEDVSNAFSSVKGTSEGMNPQLKLLVFKTRDIGRLRSFYEALGIVFAREQHGSGPPHFSGHAAATLVEIYPLADDGRLDTSTRVGFQVLNFDAVLASIEAGVGRVLKPPHETSWGEMALLADPDGRCVEIYRAETAAP